MVFLRFTNTVCDIPLGLILFSPRETDESRYHNITLYNTSWREDRV